MCGENSTPHCKISQPISNHDIIHHFPSFRCVFQTQISLNPRQRAPVYIYSWGNTRAMINRDFKQLLNVLNYIQITGVLLVAVIPDNISAFFQCKTALTFRHPENIIFFFISLLCLVEIYCLCYWNYLFIRVFLLKQGGKKVGEQIWVSLEKFDSTYWVTGFSFCGHL